jgi:hypothetical protein
MIVALAAASALVLAASAAASSAATPQIVLATMYPPGNIPSLPGKIAFLPKTVKRGTVLFKFRNRAGTAYQCELNLVSKYVAAKQVVKITVAFKRRGLYSANCADPLNPEGAGLAGQIKVL